MIPHLTKVKLGRWDWAIVVFCGVLMAGALLRWRLWDIGPPLLVYTLMMRIGHLQKEMEP